MKFTRTIHTPIGFTEEEMRGFFLVPNGHAVIAILNRLTGSQTRLWHYLMMIDPFADHTADGERIYHNLPSAAEIALKIGASKRTVEKDLRRLQELGLYDFRVQEWQGYNLTNQEAKAASDAMKRARAEKQSKAKPQPLKPAQGKDVFLTGNAVILPEVALNNQNSGYLTEDENLKPLQEKDSSDFKPGSDLQTYSDPDQIFKREKKIEREIPDQNLPEQHFADQQQESAVIVEAVEGTVEPKEPKLEQNPDPVEEPIATKWDKFSAPGAEPNFFDFVVRRTAKFPKPPADPRCAAEAWIRKQGHVLYPQFLEWLAGQKQAAARIASPPVATEPPPTPEPEKMTPLMWLERYRHMWQAGPQIQKQIRRAIFEHPERGLRIGKDGPELALVASG